MQTAIANKVDGIAVCLVDAEAFNKPTEDALSIGIPVIGYNAVPKGMPASPTSARASTSLATTSPRSGCRW